MNDVPFIIVYQFIAQARDAIYIDEVKNQSIAYSAFIDDKLHCSYYLKTPTMFLLEKEAVNILKHLGYKSLKYTQYAQ